MRNGCRVVLGAIIERVSGQRYEDYVPKPFSPRDVVARVQALLRRVGDRADGDAG